MDTLPEIARQRRQDAARERARLGLPPLSEASPCAICGWGPARGIHSPIVDGPRKGEPWGHAYRARG